MNKHFKVIQLNGLSGLFLLIFVFVGIFCGFALFPIWVIMTVWNSCIEEMFKGPSINYLQSGLLWGFLVLSFYMAFKNRVLIKLQHGEELTDIEIKKIVTNVIETPESEENEENI